jgi:hypothetical protein
VDHGKRLFEKFASEFRKVVCCGPDSPYEQLRNGLVSQANLPNTIAASILVAGFSASTFWVPLALYISLLIIKTGLNIYCEACDVKTQGT